MNRFQNQRGSAIAATVILLILASISIGAIMLTMSAYGRANRTGYRYERAMALADAGLAAAMVDLNHDGTGVISSNESKAFFSSTNRFDSANWAFQTTVTVLSVSNKLITANGYYEGVKASCSMQTIEHTTSDSIHSLYAMAIYVGNSGGATNYILKIGGTGTSADFVEGDVHVNGNIAISGDAHLRHPESYSDTNSNSRWDYGEPWTESGVTNFFSSALSLTDYNAYVASTNSREFYGNGRFDFGEAFVDTIGNGTYDSSEGFTDLNSDGVYSFGEPYVDLNENGAYDAGESFVDKGNGVWNTGEEWVDDTSRSQRVNGKYDPPGGYYLNGVWKTTYKVGKTTYSCSSWPAEQFSDEGNGVWNSGETYVDRNGTYDVGETYFDDRNGVYDYGTSATGSITGMGAAGLGQLAANGSNPSITPPDLTHMYYSLPNTGYMPVDALQRWGHDVNVSAATFTNGKITDQNNPAHIFIKNPTGRTYTKITGKDDYFLEDPTDSSYSSGDPKYITVKDNGNDKVYYVNGNVYIHNPNTLNFKFRNAGTKITIVAKGNITISDEFRYNGLTTNALDAIAFIALKDSSQTNSGNIYLGDAQFGTGGEIHAMLYAENNFLDNNLNTTDQPTLSVFGTMSAGNQLLLNRPATGFRTRLDVTLDERIRTGRNVPPGLPPAWSNQRAIYIWKGWLPISGTYSTFSRLH